MPKPWRGSSLLVVASQRIGQAPTAVAGGHGFQQLSVAVSSRVKMHRHGHTPKVREAQASNDSERRIYVTEATHPRRQSGP